MKRLVLAQRARELRIRSMIQASPILTNPDRSPTTSATFARGDPRTMGAGHPVEPKIGNKPMTKLNTAGRRRLPANDFAEPKKRAYPVEERLTPATLKLAQAKRRMPVGCRRPRSGG